MLTTVQSSQQCLITWDDSILIALSSILTLVSCCPYYRACIDLPLAENDKKTNQSCNIRGKCYGSWWRVCWLSSDTIDDWGYNTAKYFVRLLKLQLFFKKIWSDLPSIRQGISWTRAQPIPDSTSLPKLGITAQSVNIDGSGLKIHILVLKRKGEKGAVEYSSI